MNARTRTQPDGLRERRTPSELCRTAGGANIADAISERGLKQADVAARLGIHAPVLSDLIHGKRSITPETERFLETAHPVDGVLRLLCLGSRPDDTAYPDANRTPIRVEVGQRSDSKQTVFLQSPHDPAQSKGDPEVGTKEFVSIVRTDPNEKRGQFLILSTPRPASSGDTRDGSDIPACPSPDVRRSTPPSSSSQPASALPKPPSLNHP